MEDKSVKWLAIMAIGLAVASWAGSAINNSIRCGVEKAAIEKGYVQKRVGDDLLWVKE